MTITNIPYTTFPGLNPDFVDLTRDASKDTAWAWCLHIAVPPEYGKIPDQAAEAFHQAVLVATENAHTWIGDLGTNVPAACGGDSFSSWAESFPQDPDDDVALHLYMSAADEPMAAALAVAFLTLTGLTTREVALSTAGDWAEQVTIPMPVGSR